MTCLFCTSVDQKASKKISDMNFPAPSPISRRQVILTKKIVSNLQQISRHNLFPNKLIYGISMIPIKQLAKPRYKLSNLDRRFGNSGHNPL